MIDVDASTAGEVGSRNADLAVALNQIAEIRRRRLDRSAEQRVADP